MAAPKPALPPLSAYVPPQPSFSACPTCGMLCLRDAQGSLLSACLGEPHDCEKARKAWAPIARYLAGEILIMFIKFPDGSEHFTWFEPTKEGS